MPPQSAAEKDRSQWRFRKFDSFDDQRRAHIEEWQAQSGAARRAAAWELVYDYWVVKNGKHPDELRLQRSVTNFVRAGD